MSKKHCVLLVLVVFNVCTGARLPLNRHHRKAPSKCPKPCQVHTPSTTTEMSTSTQVMVCFFEGKSYQINALFAPEPCRSCWCNADGVVSCAWKSCPPCYDGELVYLQGECCPLCLTTTPLQTTTPLEGFCFYIDQKYYANGETFYPDPCTVCTCSEAGDYRCGVIDCAECFGEQVPVPGKCCPDCRTTTTYNGAGQQRSVSGSNQPPISHNPSWVRTSPSQL